MKWIVAAACVLVILAVGLLFLRNTPASLSDEGCTVRQIPADASVCFPAVNAQPWEYFQTARDTCAGQRVDDLARFFETRPKAQTVARAYSAWVMSPMGRTSKEGLRAVYTGCLVGLRED